jgi:V/A-type H+-transporting ATPase subunit B
VALDKTLVWLLMLLILRRLTQGVGCSRIYRMAKNRTGISPILVSYSEILAIIGDIVRVKVPEEENGNGVSPRLEDLAVLEAVDGSLSLAQVIGIKRDVVALQVFNGTRGISTDSTVRFLGHPMQVTYSGNIFGRVFRGTGEPIDGGPDLRTIRK